MDFRFNKSLILIFSLSSLLLSCNAVPSSRIFHIPPVSAPTPDSGVNLLGTLLNVAAEAAKEISPEILKFCIGTENPSLCADTIAPFLNDSFEPLKGLETEINATLIQAKSVSGIVTKLLGDPSTSIKALDALGICKTQYDDILDAIKEAVGLIAQQNVVDAYYKFSSVISYQSACEDAFGESPGVDNPLAKDSLTLYQLGGNCLAIMDQIVNHTKF